MIEIVISTIIVLVLLNEFRKILEYLDREEKYIIASTLDFLRDNPTEIRYTKGIHYMIDYIVNNIMISYLPNDIYKTSIHKIIFSCVVRKYLKDLINDNIAEVVKIIVDEKYR